MGTMQGDALISIAVLMTCHNRVNNTLKCLSRLFEQSVLDQVALSVYLVDDGSSDGTGDAVRKQYPDVNVINGDGSLFWNRGMHSAFEEALKGGFDYYLWLNDDTYLYRDTLKTLLSVHEELASRGNTRSIVVASTRDPDTGEFTYGGFRNTRGAINRVGLTPTPPEDRPIQCDSMCGNCVLIPDGVASIVGNIDPEYRHQWGDADYGLRAVKNGCSVWIAPGYLADCEGNPDADRWKLPGLPLKERLAELRSIKVHGKDDWFRFVRRHGGLLWPLVWISPYVRVLISSFK
jgi:GT2 family glycosyltransferase